MDNQSFADFLKGLDCEPEIKIRYKSLSERIFDYVQSCDEPPEVTGLAEKFEISTDDLLGVCKHLELGLFIKGARFGESREAEEEGVAIVYDFSVKGVFVIAEKHLEVIERWKEEGRPGC